MVRRKTEQEFRQIAMCSFALFTGRFPVEFSASPRELDLYGLAVLIFPAKLDAAAIREEDAGNHSAGERECVHKQEEHA